MTNAQVIRDALRTVLANNGVPLIAQESTTETVVQIFRGWLLEYAGEHRGNAATAETVTLRSLELIFAEQVEKISRELRAVREDVCKDPTTSEILNPNPTIPDKRNHI
jgi:hypothetical protein